MNASASVPAAASTSTRRPVCATCQRPQATCLCAWVRPTQHPVEVVILQHPLEAGQAKGTAQLLHLSLPNSRLLVGEVFAEDLVLTPPHRQTLLLYPALPDTPAAPPGDLLRRGWPLSSLRLVVPDGTWRKSRKLLHLNPWLAQLPRLSLDAVPASRYLIRKAHRPGQLSTLEAVCAALASLAPGPDGDAARFEPLLAAFDGFVAQQLAHRPGVSSTARVDSPVRHRP
ncbi:MAG: tRNA-uridine aminocarboxypropyltransferase [Polaromonas sp.]|nr:tRNA-uridine aminocarboxypropyltransferase [Polaromonas sp.]